MAGLAKAAQAVGLKTEGVQVSREGLGNVPLPAIAWVNSRHYVAVWSVQGDAERGTATIQIYGLVDGSGNFTVHWGDDLSYTFTKNVDGSFTAPAGLFDKLVR